MFRTLLWTEFNANRLFLATTLLINTFFLLLMGVFDDRPLDTYIGATTVAFVINLSILAINQSDQRRMRLYAQLPVDPSQVFWACWLFVLLWMALQCLSWLLYGLLFETDFVGLSLPLVGSHALRLLAIIALVSVLLDLSRVEPPYWQWLAVSVVVLLVGAAIVWDLQPEFFTETGPRLLTWPRGTLAFAVAFLLLLFANLQVYRHSAAFLR